MAGGPGGPDGPVPLSPTARPLVGGPRAGAVVEMRRSPPAADHSSDPPRSALRLVAKSLTFAESVITIRSRACLPTDITAAQAGSPPASCEETDVPRNGEA